MTNSTMAHDDSVNPPTPALEEPGRGIVERPDGVFLNLYVETAQLRNAVDQLFNSQVFLTGLDYAALIRALYGCAADFQQPANGLLRCADGIVPFDPARRDLYKAVKFTPGKVEYYFEPVFLVQADQADQPDAPGIPARLNVDEFIADMWQKGIRFGIDVAAVRAAIASGKSERVVVAQRLDAVPGTDARIVEVSQDLHRSDAPRQLASGKLDLVAFQNRFPQIKKGTQLLQKVPRRDGSLGFEIDGSELAPPFPKDVDLGAMAGPGTAIENGADGEFLVAQQGGFLNVDSHSHQLSINDKIVSREGVSLRTTGNLNLRGNYEEFGEVQEKRVIEGESITVHANVYGNIVSRGGVILLDSNLMGGSATNAEGDITVRGVASGAVVQTRQGEVNMTRAESCIISGTRVVVEHAINCEIIADEVKITHAEGCAVAARRVEIESAGPRKQAEMLVYVLVPDSAKLDAQIAVLNEGLAQLKAAHGKHQQEREQLSNLPEARKYLMLAAKINKKELVLTPEQQPQFQKMALAVAPVLKTIGKIASVLKQLEAEQQTALERVAQLQERKKGAAGTCNVLLRMLEGDTLVRTMPFNPETVHVYDLPAADIKQRLRSANAGKNTIFADKVGALEWSMEQQAGTP